MTYRLPSTPKKRYVASSELTALVPNSNQPVASGYPDAIREEKSTIFSPNPEKARAEQFFLLWAIVWISLVVYIVYSQWFETFTPYHYLALGLLLFLFPTVFPIVFPALLLSDHLPISRRYTNKANLYIAILSWIANYFWTHYFYVVLHATYTFKAHRLNDVPFALYMMTHSYFHFYHVLSSIMMRAIWRWAPTRGVLRYFFVGLIVLMASYIVAFLETFTIQHFPYYDIPDRRAMYLYGSMFYGIYFIVSFPMFARLDEETNSWNLSKTVIDTLACCMIVTQLLDLWRLVIGHVTDAPAANPVRHSVPFVY